MAEHPAEAMRRAAARLTGLAEAASPGPWHQMCMGSEGCSVLNDGHLRDRRHVSFSGRKEWKADHADAEYIAAMNPVVGEALAGWLEQEAGRAERTMIPHEDGLWCLWCGGVYGRNCGCWDGALTVASEILGEAPGGQ